MLKIFLTLPLEPRLRATGTSARRDGAREAAEKEWEGARNRMVSRASFVLE